VLNAAHPELNFGRPASTVVTAVNAALASGNAGTLTQLADALDRDNNQGCGLV
jgi:hypothetical protein